MADIPVWAYLLGVTFWTLVFLRRRAKRRDAGRLISAVEGRHRTFGGGGL